MRLIDELNAEEGSFLLELRTSLDWNHQSFLNLISKLLEYCQQHGNEQEITRSMASSIWHMSTFIKEWTENENFPKKHSSTYYNKCYEIIDHLTYYYFMGESPYVMDETFDKEIKALSEVLA